MGIHLSGLAGTVATGVTWTNVDESGRNLAETRYFTLHNTRSILFRSLRLANQHSDFSVIFGASVAAILNLAISESVKSATLCRITGTRTSTLNDMLFGDIGRRYLPHAILQLQVTQRSLLKFCGLQPHFEGASQIFGSIVLLFVISEPLYIIASILPRILNPHFTNHYLCILDRERISFLSSINERTLFSP